MNKFKFWVINSGRKPILSVLQSYKIIMDLWFEKFGFPELAGRQVLMKGGNDSHKNTRLIS